MIRAAARRRGARDVGWHRGAPTPPWARWPAPVLLVLTCVIQLATPKTLDLSFLLAAVPPLAALAYGPAATALLGGTVLLLLSLPHFDLGHPGESDTATVAFVAVLSVLFSWVRSRRDAQLAEPAHGRPVQLQLVDGLSRADSTQLRRAVRCEHDQRNVRRFQFATQLAHGFVQSLHLVAQLVARRVTSGLIDGFAATALGLAALGIYGLLMIAVESRLRTTEVTHLLGALIGGAIGLGIAKSLVDRPRTRKRRMVQRAALDPLEDEKGHAIGFVDVARVYVDGESPGGWHQGTGAGLWIALVRPDLGITVMRTNNPERRILTSIGFAF